MVWRLVSGFSYQKTSHVNDNRPHPDSQPHTYTCMHLYTPDPSLEVLTICELTKMMAFWQVATGDGVAMAHRAHAIISNMEFVQFHPTALADEGLPKKPQARENAFLITEAVRGAGGILYNQAMERFMPLYDDRGELAPRDVVARSIDDQLKKRAEKYVYLDISHKPREVILSHFPNIAAECLKYGLDISRQPIPVVPAAHYICGGVQTGLQGNTSIVGLFAAGEVTCTGLHGANRLASNSLLEALVFSQRAVQPSLAYARQVADLFLDINDAREWPWPVTPTGLEDWKLNDILMITASKRKELQHAMWDYVGIVRSTQRLRIAEKIVGDLERQWEDQLFQKGWQPNMVHVKVCEMRNLISVANIVISSALARQESRGLHYTIDYPNVVESERLPTVLFPSSPINSTWSSQLLHRLSLECASLPSSMDDLGLSRKRGARLVARAYANVKTCQKSDWVEEDGFQTNCSQI